MMQKKSRLAPLLSVLVVLSTQLIPGSTATSAKPLLQTGPSRLFPETGKSVGGVFLDYWNTHGGLPQQGYPISGEMQEKSDTDGKMYTVQYFERAVFELHPENAAPNNVLLSLLGNFRYKQKYPNGAPGQTMNNSAGSMLFPQTGKRVGGLFLQYWKANGGLAQQGYPISEEFQEKSDLDGKTYTVQYFERAVFEMHPENKPPYNVLLSQLGTFRYRDRYSAGDGSTQSSGKPNIVFILTDDLDASEVAYMPKLKSLLVDQGTTFSNFFVTDSLCCPSRSSIQRGQYVHNHGVLGNSPPTGGFQTFFARGNQDSTVGTWLKSAGYRTALMGKYLNGYPQTAAENYVPPGWDEWDSPTDNQAYGEYNYKLNENGTVKLYGSSPQDYLTDVISGKAANFIQQAAGANTPFFMYLATYAPHQPATPAPRHANLFPDAKAPRTPDFNEQDVSDKPQFIQNLPLMTQSVIDTTDALYRKRLQSLQAVDDLIGNVVDTLKAQGKLDSTYIVFTSDNGFHLGQKRMPAGKQTAYDTDIRVPMIVRGPGVPAGRTSDLLTMEVDFAPTFAQLAGAAAPDFVDGRSLVPLLSNNPPQASSWRQGALIEHYAGSDEPFQSDFELQQQKKGSRTTIPTYQAVRTQNYTYVEYTTGERELYDLRSDPYELQNIYKSADPELLKQLASMLDGLRKCSGANCRIADSVALSGGK
ncbi:MAG: sulfatase [Chloroflexi bacterium]|nr:sulfatase [Chloroflexota bacterium]